MLEEKEGSTGGRARRGGCSKLPKWKPLMGFLINMTTATGVKRYERGGVKETFFKKGI